jgi:glycosyltransferase involved in cell wall biosynthesis
MKTVLVLSATPLCHDGITHMILGLLEHMDQEELAVSIAANGPIENDLKQHIQHKGWILLPLPERKTHPFSYALTLTKTIKQNQIDAVYIHGSSATMTLELTAAALAGVKTRLCHAHSAGCQHKKMHKLLLPLFSALCTHQAACSKEAAQWLFPHKPCTIIANARNWQDYQWNPEQRQMVRQRLGLEQTKVLGTVGSLLPVKNQTFLIQLMTKLTAIDPAWHLLVVGEGPERKQLEALAKSIASHIHFIGSVQQAAPYLNAMDVFTLPSLYEGMPLALLEAQVSGLPCLASDRISKDADISHTVCFLPLEKPDVWIDTLQTLQLPNRPLASRQAEENARAQGLDLTTSARRIQTLLTSQKKGQQ